jgi:hypothetical protein
MNKIEIKQLESIEGGIGCSDMFDMLLFIPQAQYDHLVSLSSSGVRFQCTDGDGSTLNIRIL